MMFPMSRLEAVDIDDIEDFYFAEYLLNRNLKMKGNNFVFLSHTLAEKTPSYGNRDKFSIKQASSINGGDTANTSEWLFTNNHIGTHIDIPYHFDENGKKLSDYFADEWFFSSPFIIDLPCNTATLISEEDLLKINIPSEVDLLLIRTGFEKLREKSDYIFNNPGLDPKLMLYLKNSFLKLRCIGFDFISVTSWRYRKEGREAHRKLLMDKNWIIMAIEDMHLFDLKGQPEWVMVAPLIVENGNGGPVTVIAKINNNDTHKS